MMAGAVISALPVIAAYVVFQRHIISGLTSGMSK
jgi:ABC-type glycerol-3-phosphate transport system permease component